MSAVVAEQVKPFFMLLGTVRKRHKIVYIRTAVRTVRNVVFIPQFGIKLLAAHGAPSKRILHSVSF
jgi:hypothetical protein